MPRRLLLLLAPLVAVSAFANTDLSVSVNYRDNYLVDPGTTATFTAVVRNRATEPAHNIVLRLPFPPGSKLAQVQPGAWTCSGNDSEVVCTLAELGPTPFGTDGSRVTAKATLSTDPNGMFASDFATVSSDMPDDNPNDNQGYFETIIYRMLTVSSTADSGAGSLRGAIGDANARCIAISRAR